MIFFLCNVSYILILFNFSLLIILILLHFIFIMSSSIKWVSILVTVYLEATTKLGKLSRDIAIVKSFIFSTSYFFCKNDNASNTFLRTELYASLAVYENHRLRILIGILQKNFIRYDCIYIFLFF